VADVRELFPNCEDGSWFSHPGYSAIVASFGTVELESSDPDYQGSTYVVLRRDEKVGYLEFGWGSCSGCDALEACESYSDLRDVVERLESNIRWFDSDDELKAWASAHDWPGDWSWHEGARTFLRAFNEKFGTAIPTE
jgi:hypothetical protein